MDEQNYVFGLREFGGKSLNEIAKETGCHFNTVKKCTNTSLYLIIPNKLHGTGVAGCPIKLIEFSCGKNAGIC